MIWDLISSSTVFLYIITIGLYIYTKNTVHLIACIGLAGIVTFTEFIKYTVVGYSNPRPRGAKNCNLWCNDGIQEGQPGMPSSHAATVAFFAAYYAIPSYEYDAMIIRGGLLVYAILVILSRYVKRCHSVEQLIVGALLGALLGAFLRRVYVHQARGVGVH